MNIAANPSPGFQRNPSHRITVEPFDGAVTATFSDAVIASTAKALVLREADYPPVFYVPFEDIYFEFLKRSDTATHCPFEGEQDPDWVAHLAETLIEWGVQEVFLGETIGMATPAHVERLLDEVLADIPVDRVGVHFHDTYGQALANTLVALERGIDRMDSSAGGLGGCPYAPGASGNLATEDLLWLLDGLGIEHGIDIGAVARVASQFCEDQGLVYNSRAGKALLAARESEPA